MKWGILEQKAGDTLLQIKSDYQKAALSILVFHHQKEIFTKVVNPGK